jgi:hypothetical protein
VTPTLGVKGAISERCADAVPTAARKLFAVVATWAPVGATVGDMRVGVGPDRRCERDGSYYDGRDGHTYLCHYWGHCDLFVEDGIGGAQQTRLRFGKANTATSRLWRDRKRFSRTTDLPRRAVKAARVPKSSCIQPPMHFRESQTLTPPLFGALRENSAIGPRTILMMALHSPAVELLATLPCNRHALLDLDSYRPERDHHDSLRGGPADHLSRVGIGDAAVTAAHQIKGFSLPGLLRAACVSNGFAEGELICGKHCKHKSCGSNCSDDRCRERDTDCEDASVLSLSGP